jgi:hypothetical protein
MASRAVVGLVEVVYVMGGTLILVRKPGEYRWAALR